MDDDDEPSPSAPLNPLTSSSFFTSVKNLMTEPVVPHIEALVNELNNQALVHQLMTQAPTEPPGPEEVDDTNNFTTRSTSRYDSHYFYRVVIDTGASKYSTAGYRQFQAL